MISPELLNQVKSTLSSSDDVATVINFLRQITTPEGPIHPNDESELSIWNVAGGKYLSEGQYQDSEQVYRALFVLMIEQQQQMGRVHKGMALQNLAIAQFFQGKSNDAIRLFLAAYIEDTIKLLNCSDKVEQFPASSVLKGLCGVPQSKLFEFRKNVCKMVVPNPPFNPEQLLDSIELKPIMELLQNWYQVYIPNTWRWELQGQQALKKGDFEACANIYNTWTEALVSYQKETNERVHKGHPLFNSGLSLFLKGNRREAFGFFMLAYIEDVITALNVGEADNQPAYRNLVSLIGSPEPLKEIEKEIFTLKQQKILDNPMAVLHILKGTNIKAEKEFEERKQNIISARNEREQKLLADITEKREIDQTTDNTLYVFKRWNSSTPRFPHKGDHQALGGGYFMLWQGKGIIIDPGYDFLKIFYDNKFGIKNIDLIIITHAHDDHTQDLESIFSILNKLNKHSQTKHSIDLILSEGAQIKYGRLLTIAKEFAKFEITGADQNIDPTKTFSKPYNFSIKTTKTAHNEMPWMKTNTGFGLVINLKKQDEPDFQIGLTSDTALESGIAEQYSGVDLLIEHIGTYGKDSLKNHLCDIGCSELIKKLQAIPKLIVVSEFGEELQGHRVEICAQIETQGNKNMPGTEKCPVIAGDKNLQIKLPSLKIFCSDTHAFEDFKEVMDKEVDDNILYLKKEK
jgi:hypothetical protein